MLDKDDAKDGGGMGYGDEDDDYKGQVEDHKSVPKVTVMEA